MNQDIERDLKCFDDFCANNKQIFLYGAGKIGKLYLQILRFIGIEPKGFIISDGIGGIVDNLIVYPADEIRVDLSEDVGVIASFKGANEETIRSHIGLLPKIFIPKLNVYRFLPYEKVLFPILQRLTSGVKPLSSMSKWENILIVRIDVLGDLIMTTPFLREIRKNCPDSHITLVVRPSNRMLFEHCPYVSELILYDTEPSDVGNSLIPSTLQQISDKIEKFAQLNLTRHYDVSFHLSSFFSGRSAVESIMLSCASGAECQVGRMYYKGREQDRINYFFNRIKKFMSYVSCDWMPKHEVACMLDLLRQCGADIQDEKMELWFKLREEFGVTIDSNLEEEGYLWLAVGIVGRTKSQCWPVENYKELFNRFFKEDTKISFILLGGPEAEMVANEILNGYGSFKNVMNLTGKTTLTQVAEVINKCTLYVGSNTGLMHMAAALEKPVVEIDFYVRNKEGNLNSPMGPWGVPSIILQKKGLDDCIEICSRPFPHCIKQITVDEVFDAVKIQLSRLEKGKKTE